VRIATKLDRWMKNSGESNRSLGDQLGCVPSRVSMLRSGVSRPSLDLAIRLDFVTEGAVSVYDWQKQERNERF